LGNFNVRKIAKDTDLTKHIVSKNILGGEKIGPTKEDESRSIQTLAGRKSVQRVDSM